MLNPARRLVWSWPQGRYAPDRSMEMTFSRVLPLRKQLIKPNVCEQIGDLLRRAERRPHALMT